tara:strand:- start:192 stop:362 length:171 start_codon:yes stop_codon:yes gene_type:complete
MIFLRAGLGVEAFLSILTFDKFLAQVHNVYQFTFTFFVTIFRVGENLDRIPSTGDG